MLAASSPAHPTIRSCPDSTQLRNGPLLLLLRGLLSTQRPRWSLKMQVGPHLLPPRISPIFSHRTTNSRPAHPSHSAPSPSLGLALLQSQHFPALPTSPGVSPEPATSSLPPSRSPPGSPLPSWLLSSSMSSLVYITPPGTATGSLCLWITFTHFALTPSFLHHHLWQPSMSLVGCCVFVSDST